MNSPTEFFSPAQKAKARELSDRIRNGEDIPLSELLQLLQTGESHARKIIKEENKPTDVDYF